MSKDFLSVMDAQQFYARGIMRARRGGATFAEEFLPERALLKFARECPQPGPAVGPAIGGQS